jgi:hypothetical protein
MEDHDLETNPGEDSFIRLIAMPGMPPATCEVHPARKNAGAERRFDTGGGLHRETYLARRKQGASGYGG